MKEIELYEQLNECTVKPSKKQHMGRGEKASLQVTLKGGGGGRVTDRQAALPAATLHCAPPGWRLMDNTDLLGPHPSVCNG